MTTHRKLRNDNNNVGIELLFIVVVWAGDEQGCRSCVGLRWGLTPLKDCHDEFRTSPHAFPLDPAADLDAIDLEWEITPRVMVADSIFDRDRAGHLQAPIHSA